MFSLYPIAAFKFSFRSNLLSAHALQIRMILFLFLMMERSHIQAFYSSSQSDCFRGRLVTQARQISWDYCWTKVKEEFFIHLAELNVCKPVAILSHVILIWNELAFKKKKKTNKENGNALIWKDSWFYLNIQIQPDLNLNYPWTFQLHQSTNYLFSKFKFAKKISLSFAKKIILEDRVEVFKTEIVN